MKTIRKGVFETNSSSTHSICICTDEEYSNWRDNKILFKDEEFKSLEEVLNDIRLKYPDDSEETLFEKIEQNPWDYGFTFEKWGEDYENDHNIYTTKSGETIHILCYYGYDY